MLDVLARLRDIVIALALAWIGVSAAEKTAPARGPSEATAPAAHSTNATLPSTECSAARIESLSTIDVNECTH